MNKKDIFIISSDTKLKFKKQINKQTKAQKQIQKWCSTQVFCQIWQKYRTLLKYKMNSNMNSLHSAPAHLNLPQI